MKARLIGYARVSASEQELQMQMDTLKQAGCRTSAIYTDLASGAKSDRPGLELCLQKLRKGDTLIVWRLDRLGKSVHHLITLFNELHEKGIGFRSIVDEAIDTTRESGEMIFALFAALAQFEHQIMQENTRTGLNAARSRGRKGGRRPTAADDPKVQMVKKMSQNTTISVSDICKTLNISRATYYRYLTIAG